MQRVDTFDNVSYNSNNMVNNKNEIFTEFFPVGTSGGRINYMN